MELIKCPYCEVSKTKMGIGTHIWRVHGNGKLHDSNIGFKNKTRKIWNKGLTKDDPRVLKYSESSSKKQKGKKGVPHTEETKEKISKIRIKYLLENPDKVPYLLNHSSKESYPEKLFREALIKNNITGWQQEYRNGLYSYDFAFTDLKIDVEIDGGTHKSEKVKKIDLRRDNWSKEQGWRVIRFTAKQIKENIDNCINVLVSVAANGPAF